MNTIKIKKKNCLMIAHRGVPVIERENTCPSFIVAGNKSYFGIETDVHVTKDNKYLICHDDNILRVSNVDMIIEQSNYNDLRRVSIFDTDNVTKRSDLIFPNLKDYLLICKKYNKTSVLELKNEMKVENIIEIIEIIKNLNWFEKTIFISFSKENMINLRKISSKANLQFLTDKADENTLDFLCKYNLDLDIYYKSLNKEYIDTLHNLNIKVNCWTVDNKEEAKKLIDMGVDYITSNCLE